jgi:hypothetical protein
MPFIIRKTPGHEVIKVSLPRPYQPYDHLVLRDSPAGRTDLDRPRLRTARRCVAGDRDAMPQKLPSASPASLSLTAKGRPASSWLFTVRGVTRTALILCCT